MQAIRLRTHPHGTRGGGGIGCHADLGEGFGVDNVRFVTGFLLSFLAFFGVWE
jgi:hypothetical protein